MEEIIKSIVEDIIKELHYDINGYLFDCLTLNAVDIIGGNRIVRLYFADNPWWVVGGTHTNSCNMIKPIRINVACRDGIMKLKQAIVSTWQNLR